MTLRAFTSRSRPAVVLAFVATIGLLAGCGGAGG